MIHLTGVEITQWIGQYSYLAIFILCLISGYLIQIPPEEILLLTIGYMTKDVAGLVPVLFFVMLGFVISDFIVYWLVLKGHKLVETLTKKTWEMGIIKNSKNFFEKNIMWTIVIARITPLLRFVGPVIAGSTKAKEKDFLVANIIATIISGPVFVIMGFVGKNYVQQIINYILDLKHLPILGVWASGGVIIFLIVKLLNKEKK
jgi:membrane protein DedA with SNARE-associated domain